MYRKAGMFVNLLKGVYLLEKLHFIFVGKHRSISYTVTYMFNKVIKYVLLLCFGT